MSKIDPPAGWPDVDGIDTFERLLGGLPPTSPINRSIGNLTARTKQLRAEKLDASALASTSGSASVGFLQSAAGAVGRTVQSKLRDTVSVKDFGAIGDGLTDDTNAFQAAVASGLRLYVPEGTYKLSAPIEITTIGRFFLFGAGKFAAKLVASGTFSAIFNFTSTSAHTDISDIGFDLGATNTRAVTCTGLGHLFRACDFKGAGDGTQPLVYIDCSFCRFEFCTFGSDSAAQWMGVIDSRAANTGTSGGLVISNVFYQCFIGGPGRGLWIRKTQAQGRPEGTEIANTQFLNTGDLQLLCSNHYGLQCTGSLFQESSTDCIQIQDASDMCQFVGCTIAPKPSGASGIHILATAGKGHVITGNTFRAGRSAVNIAASATQRVSTVTISANRFGSHVDTCLALDSVERCTVTGNVAEAGAGLYQFGALITFGTHPSKGSYVIGGNAWPVNGAAFFDAASTYVGSPDIEGPPIMNSGTTAVSTAATTVVIKHGVRGIPRIINVTPEGNVGTFYILGVTPTTFSIAWSASTTCTWRWEAKL